MIILTYFQRKIFCGWEILWYLVRINFVEKKQNPRNPQNIICAKIDPIKLEKMG